VHREPHTHPHTGQPHPTWGWDRRQPPVQPGFLRISDAERAEVATALCRHFAEGRLDEEELNERLARVNAAKTRGELGPPLVDLPGLPGLPDHHTGDASTPRRGRRGRSSVTLVVVAVMLVVWSSAGALAPHLHTHVPWVVIAIVAFMILRRPGHHHRRHSGERFSG
jgi:hypothetical protein